MCKLLLYNFLKIIKIVSLVFELLCVQFPNGNHFDLWQHIFDLTETCLLQSLKELITKYI